MNKLKLLRIYEKEQPEDGYRILVDRLWPRGISKERAKIDFWSKETAPTTDLRKWFNHEDDKYPAFKEKYTAELTANEATANLVDLIQKNLQDSDVYLLYGAKNQEHNEAVVLLAYLNDILD